MEEIEGYREIIGRITQVFDDFMVWFAGDVVMKKYKQIYPFSAPDRKKRFKLFQDSLTIYLDKGNWNITKRQDIIKRIGTEASIKMFNALFDKFTADYITYVENTLSMVYDYSKPQREFCDIIIDLFYCFDRKVYMSSSYIDIISDMEQRKALASSYIQTILREYFDEHFPLSDFNEREEAESEEENPIEEEEAESEEENPIEEEAEKEENENENEEEDIDIDFNFDDEEDIQGNSLSYMSLKEKDEEKIEEKDDAESEEEEYTEKEEEEYTEKEEEEEQEKEEEYTEKEEEEEQEKEEEYTEKEEEYTEKEEEEEEEKINDKTITSPQYGNTEKQNQLLDSMASIREILEKLDKRTNVQGMVIDKMMKKRRTRKPRPPSRETDDFNE